GTLGHRAVRDDRRENPASRIVAAAGTGRRDHPGSAAIGRRPAPAYAPPAPRRPRRAASGRSRGAVAAVVDRSGRAGSRRIDHPRGMPDRNSLRGDRRAAGDATGTNHRGTAGGGLMSALAEQVARILPVGLTGHVNKLVGLTVSVAGFPAPLGSVCSIARENGALIRGEVVGFRDDETVLLPYGDLA